MSMAISLKHKYFILLFFTCIVLSAHSKASALTPYEIEYEAEIEGYDITAVRKLVKKEGNKYLISQTASTFLMSVNEASSFSINNDSDLISHDYNYQRKVIGYNKSYHVHFSDNAKKATIDKPKKQPAIASATPLYSLITYQTEIRRRLLNSDSKPLHFDIIDKGRKRFYSFSLKGEEALKTNLGKINCVKIERFNEKKKKRTIIWLAIDYEYSLVKIEHYKDSELKYRLDINKGVIGGKAIKGS